MKKILVKLGLACMAVAIFASCSNDEKQMKASVENYMNAMFTFDFEKAQQYATPESAPLLQLMAQLSGMQKTEDAAKDKNKNEGNKIEFKEVTKTSDSTGTVTFEVINLKEKDAKKAEPETLELRKRDGKWLVHQTKESPVGSGLEEEEDMTEEDAILDSSATVTEAAAPAPAATTPAPAKAAAPAKK